MPGFFGFDEGADSIDRFGDGRGYFRKRRGVGRLNAENADGDVLRKQIEKKRNRDPVRRKSDSRAILGIDAPDRTCRKPHVQRIHDEKHLGRFLLCKADIILRRGFAVYGEHSGNRQRGDSFRDGRSGRVVSMEHVPDTPDHYHRDVTLSCE